MNYFDVNLKLNSIQNADKISNLDNTDVLDELYVKFVAMSVDRVTEKLKQKFKKKKTLNNGFVHSHNPAAICSN